MAYKIYPPKSLFNTVTLPGSKSISNRAIILNALSLSKHQIENLSVCEDRMVIQDILLMFVMVKENHVKDSFGNIYNPVHSAIYVESGALFFL